MASKWRQLRDQNAAASFDDFSFYKANGRWATGASVDLAALDPATFATAHEACDAAEHLVGTRGWDRDLDPPDAARREILVAISRLRGSLPARSEGPGDIAPVITPSVLWTASVQTARLGVEAGAVRLDGGAYLHADTGAIPSVAPDVIEDVSFDIARSTAASDEWAIVARDARSGAKRWAANAPVGARIEAFTIDALFVTYALHDRVVHGEGRVVALDRRTGARRFEVTDWQNGRQSRPRRAGEAAGALRR